MPALPNPKQERFCQLRLEGKSQEDAYKLAGYKADKGAASRLSRNVGVKHRMEELHIAAMGKLEVTIETIAAQLDADRAFAYAQKMPAAAIAATMGKAKLFGLLTERSVVNVTHNYAQMTEEEIRFEIAALHAEARALKPGVQH